MSLFSKFELLPSLRSFLDEKGFEKPTEIQSRVIPLLLARQSVVGVSETGSGKTLAYALPLLHYLKDLENHGDTVKLEGMPRAIVVAPTRELGEQISKVFKSVTHGTRLRVRTALGGMPLEQSRRNISTPFEILLATPGRIVKLMELKLLDLSDVRTLVFDEADQMLDDGFLPDSKFLVRKCPENIQLGLFSATVSASVKKLMNELFTKAEVIRSSGSGKVVSTLVTKNMKVLDGKRWPILSKILSQPYSGATLLFTNTREQCDNLARDLKHNRFSCIVYRGEMDKKLRRANLKQFRDGEINLLVSTDLAGRGLDLENVARVINYHLPQGLENYLHRVGRTARAGRSGLVINLVTERDKKLMNILSGDKPQKLKK